MRTALITGAAKGIGAATARLFAENGYNVIINYRSSSEAAKKLENELKILGYSAMSICADVSDSDAVTKMFDEIASLYGGADVLVNNAGIAQTKLFTDISDEEWNRMIANDLSSVFFCCRAALPFMIRQKHGRIINISSMWGQVGGSCEVHYSAAKAGVIGLTKALAAEEGPSGITVNCIAPGVIKTDMLSSYSEEDLRALTDETPTCSLGTPFDIARTALFLADEKASFITGQIIGVNGGFVV